MTIGNHNYYIGNHRDCCLVFTWIWFDSDCSRKNGEPAHHLGKRRRASEVRSCLLLQKQWRCISSCYKEKELKGLTKISTNKHTGCVSFDWGVKSVTINIGNGWKLNQYLLTTSKVYLRCNRCRCHKTTNLEMIRWSISQSGDHNQEFTTSYINVINSELWPSFWWMTFQRIVSNFIVLRRLTCSLKN